VNWHFLSDLKLFHRVRSVFEKKLSKFFMPAQANSDRLQAGKPGSLEFKVVSSNDYAVFSTVIQPGDTIRMKLRIKQDDSRGGRGKKAMQFTDATVTVETVQADRDALSVTGTYLSDLGSGRSRCWLTDGETFTLSKKHWTAEQIQALANLRQPKQAPASDPKHATNLALEIKAMAKFEQLSRTNCSLLTYGAEYVFCALEAGAVESVILTDTLFKRQPKQRQSEMAQSSRKFRGADVIIVQRDSPHFHTISEFGGALAILRYPFDAAFCL
jgi:stalled ribosome rescue protein Dom34